MNHTLTLNPQLAIKRHFTLKWKLNLRIFLLTAYILIIALCAFYIFQVNATIKGSYLLGENEEKISQFSRENKNLEIGLSQLNSLANIETLAKELSFEPVEKVHYIQVLESAVVRTNK